MTKKQKTQNDDPNEFVKPEQAPGMPLVDPETLERQTDIVRERIATYEREIAPHVAAIRAITERERMPMLLDIEVSTPWDRRLSKNGDGEALMRFTTINIQPDGESEPTVYHKLAYQALQSEDSSGDSTEAEHVQAMIEFCTKLLRMEKRKLVMSLIESLAADVNEMANREQENKPKGKRKPKGE